jgi:hypothetical protein
MTFRLVDSGWNTLLLDAVKGAGSGLRFVCPFIKKGAVERLLGKLKPEPLSVITRFSLDDFAQGVSDLSALRDLIDRGAQIRGVKHLHAKLYLFGDRQAIVTSANLTEAALHRNHELGFVTENAEIVARCRKYFDDLWEKAGADLTVTRLDKWEQAVTVYLAGGASPNTAARRQLSDEGVDAGLAAEPIALPTIVADAPQAFVKFFGESNNRAVHAMPVFEEVRRSGCHRACTYPKGKRPRQVRDGAIMFMGRMVEDPKDIMIYGRAIGMRHVPGRDDATREDIALRDWKVKWPHYVRVHHAEFVGGTLANGISLNELMRVLKADSFVVTQRNAANGTGNTNPRTAYRQQAAVQLTAAATAYLNAQLQVAYAEYGKLAPVELAQLDWPEASTPAAVTAR